MSGSSRQSSFVGAASGAWAVQGMSTFLGAPIEAAPFVSVVSGFDLGADAIWALRGVASNMRYTTAAEAAALAARKPELGRPEATRAALISIRKTEAWWALPQDERRAIYEERSRHTSIGLEYLPRIARRLHHCRDLGEPFDFLTWFEFTPEHEGAFDELLARLRASEEWEYVDWEVDIRLARC